MARYCAAAISAESRRAHIMCELGCKVVLCLFAWMDPALGCHQVVGISPAIRRREADTAIFVKIPVMEPRFAQVVQYLVGDVLVVEDQHLGARVVVVVLGLLPGQVQRQVQRGVGRQVHRGVGHQVQRGVGRRVRRQVRRQVHQAEMVKLVQEGDRKSVV